MAPDDELSIVRLVSTMQTDVGMVREHNEDAAHVDSESMFFVVADGMGGHAAGEVASAMAVDSVRATLSGAREEIRGFAEAPSDEGRQGLVALLESSVRDAHRAVYERGIAEPDKQGMGTTLDVLLLAGPEAFVAHVGDSRTYLLRDGTAAQITTDHTVAEVLVIEGKLTLEEAQSSPLRTILVNAIGVAPEVGVEMAHVRLCKGDRVLLCSDGLHDYFPTELELASLLGTKEPAEALSEVVELAKARGGHDNITGVLLEVLEAPEPDEDDDYASVSAEVDSQAIPEEIHNEETAPVDGRRAARATPSPGAAAERADNSESAEKTRSESQTTVPIQVISRGEDAAGEDAAPDDAAPDDDDH